MNSLANPVANQAKRAIQQKAFENFNHLYRKLIRLYAMGSTGSVSKF